MHLNKEMAPGAEKASGAILQAGLPSAPARYEGTSRAGSSRPHAKRATSSSNTSTIFSSEVTGMNSFTPW